MPSFGDLYEYKGLYCRYGTYDAYVINEIERTYGKLLVKGKTVMDIGANIGAFTRWAVEQGALRVIAYEPLPANYRILQLNTDKLQRFVTLNPSAVSIGRGNVELFYVPDGKNPGNTSLKIAGGRQSLFVHRVDFWEQIDQFRPECIKVDIEGGEYDFLDGSTMPDFVKEIVTEIHLTKKQWREVDAPKLVASFAGWEAIKEPKVEGKNWTTIGHWRRP